LSTKFAEDDVALRRAGPADAATLAALHAASFARGWDEASMAQFLAAPSCLCLVASSASAKTPQGFLIARAADDEAEILTLAVLPESRRRGLARALLAEAIATLSAAGAKRLFLEVEESNVPARRLYQTFGAVPVGERKAYYEHGADASIFCLAL
jgi:ribosomal-protein-alanine N-acetyltransferase